ncbi:hypothetical protein FRB94_011280 [Tulasnella sp. JGI-2019a]|nr:hypothetical protein FRB93_004911 [Tulasnella sp. JGI-2019a]KAG8992809.1 hypothetical protein FRB94_011280 [Tulasnella sp. JGI-2019a]KAG9028433.1 hypothetical protein FRB95_006511 [Tulasnella sp. JGI-2019a]
MPFWKAKEDEQTWSTAHDEVTNLQPEHKAKISHELLAAAASYEAAKAYNEHEAKNGKPQSHEKAKEIIAGLSGAFIDRMIETKGLDAIDKHKAKKDAEEQIQNQLAQHY